MMFLKPKKEYGKSRGGFMMLYAILITTVILSIALSLLGVLIEHVPISGLERESSLAFAAADSGMECALYWDSEVVTPPEGAFRSRKSLTTYMSCNGANLNDSVPGPSPYYASGSAFMIGGVWYRTDTYKVWANFGQGTCATMVVYKTVFDSSNAVSTTTVESRGYNTTCPKDSNGNPVASAKAWRLERGLKAEY